MKKYRIRPNDLGRIQKKLIIYSFFIHEGVVVLLQPPFHVQAENQLPLFWLSAAGFFSMETYTAISSIRMQQTVTKRKAE